MTAIASSMFARTIKPLHAAQASRPTAYDRVHRVLGVNITDVVMRRAITLVEGMIRKPTGRTRSVYFVNAHTLNLAAADLNFREILNGADYVFGDGTGIRWAARLRGLRVKDNLVGTDLTPSLFKATAGRGYRFFMLGADPSSIERAARHAQKEFPGWTLAGSHHGYVTDKVDARRVIDQINASGADILLVGMGNPIQERWLHEHRDQLNVPVSMAVGGLFNYWAGDIRRAPDWLRKSGLEWLGILLQQPKKARRYLLGNPLFLLRVVHDLLSGRCCPPLEMSPVSHH